MNLNKSNILKRIYSTKIPFIVCIFIILLYHLPYIILGKNAELLVFDNLDSVVSWIKILITSGNVFSSPASVIPQIFNGIPRSSLYGTYDISLIWFYLFGIYGGYVVNKILMSLVGFVGMYLLLKKYILSQNGNIYIQTGVALLFSLLPFWSISMSVCGLPILLFAFWNLRNNEKKFSDWLIILVFPFCSSLILTGLFFLICISLVWVYDFINSKVINYRFLIGIFLTGILYFISHFPLFYNYLYHSGTISHRAEFKTPNSTLLEAAIKTLEIFSLGQVHTHSLHTLMILPILITFFLVPKKGEFSKWHILSISFILITSFFYGFLNWGPLSKLNVRIMSIIPLQLDRFHVLHPMFWYILLGLSFTIIARYVKFGNKIAIILFAIQFLYTIKSHEIFANRHSPSYSQFYAEQQFSEIKSFIKESPEKYRMISIGIHPAIAQFNGFYTLDGYICDYPLKYKHTFRTIISTELDKNNELRDYFDNWGSRCYAFTSELGRDFLNPHPQKIEHLDYNFDALKNLGGKFIISSAEINSEKNSRLKLLKIFINQNSYWQIYLYEIL